MKSIDSIKKLLEHFKNKAHLDVVVPIIYDFEERKFHVLACGKYSRDQERAEKLAAIITEKIKDINFEEIE